MQESILLEFIPVNSIKIFKKQLRFFKPLRSDCYFPFRIKLPYFPGRISCGDSIWRYVIGDYGPGPYDAVLTNGNSFTDSNTVPQPDIIFNPDRRRPSGRSAIVDVMPVGIGKVDTVCHHAVVTDNDLGSSAYPGTGANQAVIADFNSPIITSVRPNRKPNIAIWCSSHINTDANFNR